MAISEETAALVAAQLTTAWASMVGEMRSAPDLEDRVIQTYRRMRAAVQEKSSYDYDLKNL